MRFTAVHLMMLLTCSPWALAEQAYKWVDSAGVTHFDALPPENRLSTPIQMVKPYTPAAPVEPPPTPGNTGPDQASIDHKVRKSVAEENAKLRAYCTTVRTNLAQLQNNPRLRMEVDGKIVRLTEPQRQQKIAEAKAQITERCQ
jgi:hypothetical protein